MSNSINSSDQLHEQFKDSWDRAISELYPESNPMLAAARYAMEGSGKRVRPILCMLSAAALNQKPKRALPAAIALEMVHTYSLVHDDLPCMDDDDHRRGRKTVHVEYSDGLAVLAGDSLLTDSFKVLASDALAPNDCKLTDTQKIRLIMCLARASGSDGMIQGQLCDLHWTGRSTEATMDDLVTIHRLKTGQLLAAACAMGAISAGAPDAVEKAFWQFGENVGIAFQIIDDLLDKSGETGKSQGKDEEQGKLTFLSHLDHLQATEYAEQLTADAIKGIKAHEVNADALINFCETLLARRM